MNKLTRSYYKFRDDVRDFLLIALAVGVFLFSCSSLFNPEAIASFAKTSPSAIYSGPEDSKMAAIACNVYQGNDSLSAILDILKEEGVHITFFVGGVWANNNPDLLKRIVDEGHEVGNHGYNHKLHSKLNQETNRDEIMRCESIVKDISGYKMSLFMPPSGDFNQLTVDVASVLGYRTILWDADTIDWRDQDADLITRRVEKKMHPGAIVLTHPTPETVRAFPAILKVIRDAGLEPSPVGEMLDN